MSVDEDANEQHNFLVKRNDSLSIASEKVEGEVSKKDTNRGGGNGENNEEEGKEKIPLLLEGNEIVLTTALEEEIIGPESFTWCGIGWLTSDWLQKLASPEVYLVIFSLAAFSQGIFFSYNTGTISTVERRFKLPSAVSGFISSGNDMLQLFLSLHLAYAAGNGHRPRWLGGGLLLSACGSFLIITPHLIFGAGDYSDLTVEHLETTNETSEINKGWAYCGRGIEDEGDCTEGSSAVGLEQYAVASIQFIGQAMSGLANVCFYVVGYSYLDEAVSKDKVPLYFGVSGCMRIFGPVTGMALSGYAVGKWVELGIEPVIKPSHPRWVGAWWLGYPFIMMVLILTSLPMVMMPRLLPGARERTLTRLRAAAKQGKEAFAAYRDSLRPLERPPFREMLPGLRQLSRNKIFLTILLNQTFFWFVLVGYWMFQLKYMEHQFKMPAADANKAMALAGMVASLIGWLGMGSILTFLKPSSKVIMYSTMTISLLCMVTFLCQITIKCDRDHVIGLEAVLNMKAPPLKESHNSINDDAVSSCMANCSCPAHYSLVCVDNKQMFFSACHAGCKQQLNINGSLMFRDCTCTDLLMSAAKEVPTRKVPVEVRSGPCLTGCDTFIYYLTFTVLSSMLISSNRVIANVIFFRSVDERNKDLALGVLNLILSFSFVFAPIIIGSLIDYSCLLWQRTCGRRGYCYLYDLDLYRWILHAIPVFGMALSFLTEAVILRWHEDIDFFGEKEMEQLQLVDLLREEKEKKMKEKEEKAKKKSIKEGGDQEV